MSCSSSSMSDPDRNFFSTLREALRGSHGDFTEGPVGRAVILLAVPIVLEMALEPVFAIVVVFSVSKPGAAAVATAGITGAAVATTTGRGIAVCVQLATLARGTGRLGIRRAHLRLDPRTMLALLR